ncbi:g protein-coupled receptor [Anaeramoeba ignava]|uniref:G protein-coupled receptor n=1 Tax=Anaeramoeba ignava TaxID=1746090 RepID=A0A9Q0LWQ1_ANAIG|nr:g protein-coupled receptor [Anaeramoeba ignava]
MFESEEISALVGSALGIFGALMIIILFSRIKQINSLYRNLLILLSIYDFLESFSFILPGRYNKTICEIQFYLISISVTITPIWSAIISFIFYLKFVKKTQDKILNRIYKWFHLFFLIPITILLILSAHFTDYRNSTTYWCCSTKISYLIIVYSFIWLSLLICLVFYSLTLPKLTKSHPDLYPIEDSQISKHPFQKRMGFVPLIYILIVIPATIRRIIDFVTSSKKEYPIINILHSLFICSQGFWDFLIFVVFDSRMRKSLKNCLTCQCNKHLSYSETQDNNSTQKELDERKRLTDYDHLQNDNQ